MKINLIILISTFILCGKTFSQENSKPYESYQGCGEYWVAGTVRINKTGYFLIVNEKTQSEYRLKTPIIEEPKLSPYVDKPMKARILITKKIDGTIGEINKILTVEYRISNPLHPNFDTGFRSIKKMICKK